MMKNVFKSLLLYFLLVLVIGSCSKDDEVTITDGNNTLIEQQKVFKEFWDIYDRHYPLMHRKDIDWQNVYDTYNLKITNTTSDNQLFGVFETIMGTIIKDGHSSLTFGTNQEAGFEPEFDKNIQNMIQNNTASKVNIVSSSTDNPYLSYGTIISDSNIGYINSKNFEPVNENDSEFNNFKAIVDEALTALQNKTGIIIDVRTNGGGQGPFAYYLAGRFFANNIPIELIRQRIKITTGSTVASLGEWAIKEFEGYPDARVEGGFVAGVFPEDNTIVASGSFQFTKKVVVLTSKGTASAAEYFTAAMKTQPHIRTIGNTTFGIFAGSDIFTLTNGGGKWKTRVSTHDVEVKYNDVFQSFEGIGILPDVLSIPTAKQVSDGDDVHLNAAVAYVKK